VAGKGVFGDGGRVMERKPFELKQIMSLIETDKLEALQVKAKKFDRAVELLRQICSNRDELWESGHDELFENIEALLRGLEGE